MADHHSIEAFLSAHENLVEPALCERGQRVDAWRVVAFLGRGSSGEVYRVEHLQLGFFAAMKVLTRDDARSQDRFRREAAIFATSAHPAFPRFLGYGETEGRPYLVLELLEDVKLPSTDREIARYLLKVCDGVSYLHSLGFVHRDIKPANILCREKDGQPVLIDLGLVKDTALPTVHGGESLSLLDGKAVGVGTPKYSAPEQFSGGTISPAADVHALGMLANECFGGNPPRSWAHIIRRSTSSIPSQRYESVCAFADAIRKRHWSIRLTLVCGLLAMTVFSLAAWREWRMAQRSGRAGSMSPPPRIAQKEGAVLSTAATSSKSPYQPAHVPGTQPAHVPGTQPAHAPGNQRANVLSNQRANEPSNRVFMVTDDESPSRKSKKRVTYPQAGVFGGNQAIDSNF